MMEELQKKLAEEFDKSELSSLKEDSVSIDIRNGALREISVSGVSGKSLRVVKNGRLGSNFTMGGAPGFMDALIRGAERSAEFGPEAVFSFSRHASAGEALPADETEGALIGHAEDLMSFVKAKDSSIPLNIRAPDIGTPPSDDISKQPV
jgi:predicted Zn-dependent protease